MEQTKISANINVKYLESTEKNFLFECLNQRVCVFVLPLYPKNDVTDHELLATLFIHEERKTKTLSLRTTSRLYYTCNLCTTFLLLSSSGRWRLRIQLHRAVVFPTECSASVRELKLNF